MKRPKKKMVSINQAWMQQIRKKFPEVSYISFVTKPKQKIGKEEVEGEWGIKILLEDEVKKHELYFKILEKVMQQKDWEYIVNVLKNKSYNEPQGDVSQLQGQ